MFLLIFNYFIFSDRVVPQLKIDNCIQNNVLEIVNAASQSAVLGTLHSDRPKVI